MIIVIQPFHLIIFALAGWLNRQQQAVIDYLMEENRVLKEQLEGQRLRFTGQQRIRLAVKAEVVGRRTLYGLEKLLTPDTLLGWHRKLIEVDLCPEGTGSALRCAGDRGFGSPHGERECLLRLRSNPRRARQSWSQR